MLQLFERSIHGEIFPLIKKIFIISVRVKDPPWKHHHEM